MGIQARLTSLVIELSASSAPCSITMLVEICKEPGAYAYEVPGSNTVIRTIGDPFQFLKKEYFTQ